MQPRRIARELALLSLSQLPTTPEKLETQQLSQVLTAAVRTLTTEAQEAIENASAELKRSHERLLHSETRAADVQSARAMVSEAVELTEKAINRVGSALELPEVIHLANQQDVRSYALELLLTISRRRSDIDSTLNEALKDWQLNRLARIDSDILRIAAAEMGFLGVKEQIAINEAVELAKRYSDEDGHRFINGILRRVNELMKAKTSLG